MPDREKVKAFLLHLSLNAYEYKQSDDTVCGYDYLDVERISGDALALLKEQERIIKQYQKADGFLFTHGWKWEGR